MIRVISRQERMTRKRGMEIPIGTAGPAVIIVIKVLK